MAKQVVTLALNGERVEVESPDPSLTLISFLRTRTRLTGTKLSCGEGGCGACLVLCSSYDPASRRIYQSSINACLALLCSLDCCSITTIEALSTTDAHSVQQRISGFHGSQCGFCTPGMSIALYSCLQNNRNPNSNANPQPHPRSSPSPSPSPNPWLSTLPGLSLLDAQKAIVGNICRCTGYRPILDACKSFSAEVDIEDLGLNTFLASPKQAQPSPSPPQVVPNGMHSSTSARALPDFPEFLIRELDLRYLHLQDFHAPPPLFIRYKETTTNGLKVAEERLWIQASSVHQAFEALRVSIPHGRRNRIKFVVGNTGAGYYKDLIPYSVYVDISRIPELLDVQKTPDGLRIGAAVTIEKLISVLKETHDPCERMIADALVSHLKKVANPHVRHRASVGGNLILAQQSCFASDLVPLFLTIEATIRLVGSCGNPCIMALEEFMDKGFPEPDMLLESVLLPLSTKHEQMFKSYRVAPRELGNALAFINAAFLVTTVSHSSEGVLEWSILDVNLAFGAFGNAHAIRTHVVEDYLTGKAINADVLIKAIGILKDELFIPLKHVKECGYRSSVAVSLFFEFFQQFLPHGRNDILTSSILDVKEEAKQPNHEQTFQNNRMSKGNSIPKEVLGNDFHISGNQIVPVYEADDFIGEPIQKTEAAIQASGEAVYVDDIPSPQHCLFATFVGSTKAFAKVKSIDTSHALESPGVVTFITADDIPKNGKNIGPLPLFDSFPAECLFARDVVEYVGHPLGIVVADSQEHAMIGASMVTVEYEVQELPILGIEDAVERDSFFVIQGFPSKKSVGDTEKGLLEADHRILNAEVKTGSQYYFYMETQTALAIPDEDDCMVIYSSSQSPEDVQKSISVCLGIPNHNVRVITRRVGGGFGGKARRNITVASACAVAAKRLRCPVRMYLDRKTDILMMGGRHPTKTIYSVGFKSDGKVTGLSAQVFIDAGWSVDLSPMLMFKIPGGLTKYNWGCVDIDIKICKTNLCSKSAMRAPGYVQGSFIADTIMEHVAATLGLDVHTVITRNLHTLESAKLFYPYSVIGGTEGYTLPSMWDTMLKRVECMKKDVATFNSVSSWSKRGLSVIPCIYNVIQLHKPARVSIFHDGSIVVEVGGIEIGQGLWTKVKQATIYGLRALCPANTRASESLNVRVVQADSISLPHGGTTADSTASEGSCEAVRAACQMLVDRLMPFKLQKEQASSDGHISWLDLIKLATLSEIDLSAQFHWFPDKRSWSYLNYGVAATEVEVNVLTGAVTILKSDLIYDCGRSLNPAVDIGQIEGAFVQGIGFFLTEEYEVDDKGEVVSNSTWTYKPPTLDNIPQKFLVEITNGAPHTNRILSSKACGEPPVLLAGSVHSAVRHAIEAVREERRKNQSCHDERLESRYFELDTPATMEKVKVLCGLNSVEEYLKREISQG